MENETENKPKRKKRSDKFHTLRKMYNNLLPEDRYRISIVLDILKREMTMTLSKTAKERKALKE